MSQKSGLFKVSTILWSLSLGLVLICLASVVILPSTKRARPELMEMYEQSRKKLEEEERKQQQQQQALATEIRPAATATTSTAPSTQPR